MTNQIDYSFDSSNLYLPTVTVNVQVSLASFPAPSVAVQVTVVSSLSGNMDSDGGSHDTVRISSPSEAVGSV